MRRSDDGVACNRMGGCRLGDMPQPSRIVDASSRGVNDRRRFGVPDSGRCAPLPRDDAIDPEPCSDVDAPRAGSDGRTAVGRERRNE